MATSIRRDDPPPQEIVEALEALLDAARRGTVTGIIFGVSLRGQRFYCDSAGSLSKAPVLALGVATMLISELEHRSRRTAVHDTQI